MQVAQLADTNLRSAEIGDPLYPIESLAIVLVHDLHLALQNRPRWLCFGVQPNQHRNLSSVEHVVAIDIVGREGRPSTHDFIEVWLADDRLPFVVEDVVKPASDPRFARRRKFHLKCLLQELELDKVVTKVVNADVEEELSPLLNLSFENFLCSNVRLYP